MHVQAQARPQPSALHSHKRASHISVRANIASVAVVLVDDRHQRNIEVVQVIMFCCSAQHINMSPVREEWMA